MITSFFKTKKRKADDAKTDQAASATASSPSTPATSCSDAVSSDKEESNSSSKKPRQQLVVEETSPSVVVQDLLTCLNGSNEEETFWRKALDRHFSSKRFESLAKFVASQRKSATVYPPPQDVFSALNLTPLDQVKLVIIGQDPYHGPNQGHGLCFSVRKGVQVPPSLKNIYKELQNDPKIKNFSMPSHGYLERWARQGILLLNAVLTVRRGEANSHKGKGWEDTTDEILRALARDRRQPGKKGLVYLLWGKPAAKKMESVLGGKSNSSSSQVVISTSHPSPLGATKTNAPFLGSRCFSRANEALEKMGHDPIDWNVDGDLAVAAETSSSKKIRLVDV